MKLSVLIPMYNANNYIGNCIESLVNQDISEDDYEIVIIDDGSKDNSVAIVKDYAKKHKNIQLHQEPNSGAYSTRNKLLKLAKGEYIYNLDADDYITKNCLGTLLRIAESNQLEIIGFKTKETLDLDRFESDKSMDSVRLELLSGKELIEKHTHFRFEIWWYFIKKDFLLEHALSFTKNEYNADVVFTLNALLKSSKVGYIPVSLHRYVQTQDSLMRSKNFDITRKRIEYMQMMIGNKSQLLNQLNAQTESSLLLKNLKYRRDIFTFFNILDMVRNPFNIAFVKTKIKEFKNTGAYPIKHLNNYRYNGLKYRVLKSLLNNEIVLYNLIRVKNMFSKQSNSSF